ncbi:hypothetical protein PHMEG_00029775, partial [Phytophthora megakarya]
ETLDVAIPAAEKDANTTILTDLLEKLLLVRVNLLDPELNTSTIESDTFKSQLRESQLWQTLEYFEGKRQICGHIRTAEVLLNFLRAKGVSGHEQDFTEILRAVALVDSVSIGKLSTSDATSFMKLALAKVDMIMTHSATGRQASKDLLVKLLRDLELPGGADPTCRHQLQVAALLKLVDIVIDGQEEESDDEVRKCLEESVDVLRVDNEASKAASISRLVWLLPKIGRWRAARGDIVSAEEALEESVELLRSGDPSSERLYEALVGLCVVQIRLGMLEEATQVMKEIETLPVAQTASEMTIIKGRLQAAVITSRKEKEKKSKGTQKHLMFEKEHPATTSHSLLCGIGQKWWRQWCGSLVACVAAAAVALMFT